MYEPDQLSIDPLKPEDVGFHHFQSFEPRGSSATDLAGKTERKSLDNMETQTLERQNTQSCRDEENDSVHDPLQGENRLTAEDTKTERNSFDIKTRTSDRQDAETRCDKQKDSEHHALQTDSSTTDGDAKAEINSLDIETQTSKEQNTREKSDQEKDALLHTLQTGCSTTDGDVKTEKNSLDTEAKTSKEKNTLARRDQNKDSVQPPQFQTDETQPDSFVFMTSSHEKQETEEDIDTSDDHSHIPSKPSMNLKVSDLIKIEKKDPFQFDEATRFCYSGTSPYGHLFNTDTSLLRTVHLVPERPKSI